MYNRVAQPQVVEILKVAVEVGKMDINQLLTSKICFVMHCCVKAHKINDISVS